MLICGQNFPYLALAVYNHSFKLEASSVDMCRVQMLLFVVFSTKQAMVFSDFQSLQSFKNKVYTDSLCLND